MNVCDLKQTNQAAKIIGESASHIVNALWCPTMCITQIY